LVSTVGLNVSKYSTISSQNSERKIPSSCNKSTSIFVSACSRESVDCTTWEKEENLLNVLNTNRLFVGLS
jgi:hypothetical protein